MIFVICSMLFCYPLQMRGQTVPEKIKEAISQNILSYHIRNALDYDLHIQKEYLNGDRTFFTEFANSQDHILKLDFEKFDTKYPLKGYELLHITKKGFQFVGDSTSLFLNLTSIPFDEDYIIAFNSETQQVKFISGNFFKNKVSQDFALSSKDIKSVQEFINLKKYNLKLSDIKFQKRLAGQLYFLANCGKAKERIIVKVNETDFDEINVKFLQKTFSY